MEEMCECGRIRRWISEESEEILEGGRERLVEPSFGKGDPQKVLSIGRRKRRSVSFKHSPELVFVTIIC